MAGNRSYRHWMIVLSACLISPAAWPQVVREKTALYASPQGGTTIGQLPEGATLQVVERSGFWLRVRANNLAGWVRITAVKFGSSGTGPVALDTGRTSRGNIVSTSAARGMSKGQLLAAVPDLSAVERLNALIPAPESLAEFRAGGSLEVVRIAALKGMPASTPKVGPDAVEKQPRKESEDSDGW